MRSSDGVRCSGKSRSCLLRWLGLALLLIRLSFPSGGQARGHEPSAGTQPRPQGLCYAFLRSASLWTACEGKRERIELGASVDEFAVSPDGADLVIQKQERGTHGDTSLSNNLTIIPIKDKTDVTTLKVDAWGQLYTTCGTIVFFRLANSNPLDVLTSNPLPFAPYEYFRCSSDRRSIVGWTEQDDAKRAQLGRNDIFAVSRIPLRTGRSGDSILADIEGPLEFDISPNGEFASYFKMTGKFEHYYVCVARISGSQACVPDRGDRISIANNGDVIFWYAFEPVSDIRYWHLGSPKTVLLEKGASNPQWITPEAAASLHAWNKRAAHP